MCKLKRLKLALKSWNKNVFGDVHRKVAATLASLEKFQMDILRYGDSEEYRAREIACHEELNAALIQQQEFFSQWNRLDWLMDGDRNTTFFQLANKMTAKPKAISSLHINNIVVNDARHY